MTLSFAIDASTSLLLQVLSFAVRVLVLGSAAGLGLAGFRVKATSARLFTWTTVLYAAIAMPLLGWMLPSVPVPTPAFPQHKAAAQTASAEFSTVSPQDGALSTNQLFVGLSRATKSAARAGVGPARAGFSFQPSSINWLAVVAGIYFAGALFLLGRFFVGLLFARRLRRAAQPVDDPRVTQKLATRAHVLGLVVFPLVAESELIAVPVTMGVHRSMILLPSNWREWNDTKLDAVVAHEMSHIARRDALTQRLAILHRAIFWFSPFAWWLNRHLANLAEQASDETALCCGVDRRDYATTLLGFFEALQAAPGRVWWQGVSMAKAGQAEQRVERILAWKGAVAMRINKSIVVVAVIFAAPVVYLVAAAQPGNYNAEPQIVHLGQDQTAPPAIAPAPPAPSVHPRKPASSHSFSSFSGYDDDQSFVIVSGKTDSLTMSGTSDEAEMVEELRHKIDGDFIWFRRDDKSYIIRDQATIDRAKKLWAPQEELGKRQEELGKQQEVLGEQQEELGAKMEQVKVNVPDMTAELDKLKAELKNLNSTATMEQVGRIQSELGELQSKVGDLQSQAGEEQSKIGEQMGSLGEKQGKLGEQQGELGRQQGELAKQATRQIKHILDEAIAKGTAQLQR